MRRLCCKRRCAELALEDYTANWKFNPSLPVRASLMSLSIQPITASFAVAPQLSPEDMPGVAAAGYRSVIINRPDFEGGADQPTAAAVSKAALNAGLQVEYQPIISGAITAADVARFAELLRSLPGPILAYCRSGTRCAALYAATQQITL